MTPVRPYSGARILLGVSGGIASYKSAWLARLLSKAGAAVDVVMTPAATEFIGAVTFEALTGRPALLADLRANSAGIGVQVGGAEHEIGAGLTHFGAIHQQADVSGIAHLAALREAMGQCQHADAVAIAAVLDALLHLVSCGFVVDHWTSVAIWGERPCEIRHA